jgi:hypothetical protein
MLASQQQGASETLNPGEYLSIALRSPALGASQRGVVIATSRLNPRPFRFRGMAAIKPQGLLQFGGSC